MKLKYLLTVILFFVALANSYSQAPAWKWAKSATGNQYDQSSAVATDPSGNVYVAGYFASDSVILDGIKLINAGVGFDDMFIAKYDSSGSLIWAQVAGGTADDKANSLATDAAGNVYLTGYFYSPSIVFGTYTLTNTGSGDIFIVKYDNAGNVLWAKKEGGTGLEIPYSINVDTAGNISVAGRFSSLSITFGATTLTQAGSMDVFLVKYDAAGNVLWAKGAGGGSNDEAYGISHDAAGNIFVAGYFNQTAAFGTYTLTTAGSADVFVAKYDLTGNVLWANRAGGNNDERAQSVSTDSLGNSYVTGYFTSASITFGTYTLTSGGTSNSFIVKYDAGGNVVWAQAVYGNSKALVVVAKHKEVYVCGGFSGDTLTYGSSVLLIQGNKDLFILHCDTEGNSKWAAKQTSGGVGIEYAYAVTTDTWGNVYMAGDFDSNPIAFGSSVLHNTVTSFDMFVARLGNMTTGIEDIQNKNEFVVYPNPTHDVLTLSGFIRVKAVVVYNLAGKKVLEQNNLLQENRNEINISSLPSGIYFMNVSDGKKQFARKFIIARD